jgi:16S rRNA (guanine966-N2)-methyltransferase
MAQRVIGGNLRGKKLRPVPGDTIRPTGNRQKESIFNIISGIVHGAIVLDLFAGTGALGIEALSRGADFAVFIDVHKTALSVLDQNIQSCGVKKQTRVIRWNIQKDLGCLSVIGYKFNLVFMDPPYNKGYIEPTLFHLHRSQCLEAGTILVVEHAPLEPIPKEDIPYCLYDKRRYGKTLVSFLNY